MHSPNIFEILSVKIEQANKHIEELERATSVFHDATPPPYEIYFEDSPKKLERTYRIRVHKKIPLEISALIGDVLHNLRSALDHLAWHLVTSRSIEPKATPSHIYFPIFETAQKYHANKMRKIQGMTKEAIQIIDAIEPYYKSDDGQIGQGTPLWCLHTLNIQDKHKLLILQLYLLNYFCSVMWFSG